MGLILAYGRAQAWESSLFGPAWEATPALSFDSDKILQDFSFAGYRRGEQPLPVNPPGATFHVVSYGADPTGVLDSTVAIQNAINAAAAAGGGIVLMPAGTFRVSPQGTNAFALQINTSGVVLRGAGVGQTFLLNTATVMRNKFIINVTGPANAAWTTVQSTTTNITSDLLGPVTQIPVASVAGFAVGDPIIVRADPGDAWATEHLEDGWVGVTAGSFGRLMYYRQIVAIDPVNNVITIDIPTRYALKVRDNARVYKKTTLISETGLEHFSIGNVQHPGTTGWGEEDYTTEGTSSYDVAGSYAIRLIRVRDGWIRHVSTFQAAGNTTTTHILNNGILLVDCSRVTVKSCDFRRPQFGGGGGAGYMYRIQNSGDCLVRDSTAEFSRHGFVFSHMATSGNVLHACVDRTTGKQTGSTGNQNTSGKGSDHHMYFSHSNLVDFCTADGSWFEARYRPFGSLPLHNLTSAHGVFWNTEGRGSAAPYVVHSQQSRYGYVIGTRGPLTAVNTGGSSATKTAPVDHVEGVALGDTLTPASLFLEQRRRRLALPTVKAMADRVLLFPQNTLVISPQVRFGDSETPPADATFAWTHASGPGQADLQSAGGHAVDVAFTLPGTHQLTLTVRRHGRAEEDWVATASVTVHMLPSGTVETELFPVADAFVQSGTPDANYNTNALWMKFAGSTSTVNREIFMRFDLSSLASRVVRSAELQLTSTEPDIAAVGQTHLVANDAWTETGITWATKPAVGALLQSWPLAADYVQLIDVSASTTTEAAGDGLLSLRHSIQSQVNSAPVYKYASREHATSALRPRLRVRHSEVWPSFAAWMAGFSSVPTNQRDPDDDPDGDGLRNLEEYARRTPPHLAQAFTPSFLVVRDSGGASRLILPQGATLPAGVQPLLEYNTRLSANGWQALPRAVRSLEGADLRFLPPAELTTLGRCFYRLRLEVVPEGG